MGGRCYPNLSSGCVQHRHYDIIKWDHGMKQDTLSGIMGASIRSIHLIAALNYDPVATGLYQTLTNQTLMVLDLYFHFHIWIRL